MYLHHTPIAEFGTIAASAIIRADISVNGPGLSAVSRHKRNGIKPGDDVRYQKVLYKVVEVTQGVRNTKIVAHEAK